MGEKRHAAEDIVANLTQVGVLMALRSSRCHPKALSDRPRHVKSAIAPPRVVCRAPFEVDHLLS
jgi:hypothetical protein